MAVVSFHEFSKKVRSFNAEDIERVAERSFFC